MAACALVRALRRADIDTGAMKPLETGVGAGGPLDALALWRAAGEVDPLADVCPLQFALPAAPYVAAQHEGRPLELERVLEAFERLAARHRAVVVEGAGGLLVPIAEAVDMAALAGRLELPVIIVARASLGTINHTLLTLAVAEQRGLEVAGVVVSHQAPISDADQENLAFLRRELGELLLTEIPFMPHSGAAALGEGVRAAVPENVSAVEGTVGSGEARVAELPFEFPIDSLVARLRETIGA